MLGYKWDQCNKRVLMFWRIGVLYCSPADGANSSTLISQLIDSLKEGSTRVSLNRKAPLWCCLGQGRAMAERDTCSVNRVTQSSDWMHGRPADLCPDLPRSSAAFTQHINTTTDRQVKSWPQNPVYIPIQSPSRSPTNLCSNKRSPVCTVPCSVTEEK